MNRAQVLPKSAGEIPRETFPIAGGRARLRWCSDAVVRSGHPNGVPASGALNLHPEYPMKLLPRQMLAGVALAAAFCAPVAYALNTTYYVDATAGSDSNNGTSSATPWQSLTKINATTFGAGDQILLKRGATWNGQLYPKGSGTSTSPITLSVYGTGNAPVINGGSLASGAAVYLKDQSYWVVQNLEVTNDSGTDNSGTATTGGVARYGILAEATTTQNGITIQYNYVHHVNGSFNNSQMDPHINGGISVHSIGSSGKFNGVTILDNTVDRCGRVGIVAWHEKYYNIWMTTIDRTKMSTGLLVQGNVVSNSDGDGILVFGYVGSVIEYNVSKGAGLKAIAGFNMNASAGIWPTRSADTVMQFNESSGCRTNEIDGQGFDVDLLCDNTIVQYNYSHNNEGGFLLLMGGYNSNVIVRYNLSANDGPQKGIFTLSWGTPTGLKIYNNTVYIGSSVGAVRPIYTDGDASTNNYEFTNNVVYNLGSGEWELPTVSGVKYGTFAYNHFYGNHPASEPADANKLTSNPLFVSPGTSGDGFSAIDGYKLQTTSPAINSGTVIASNGGLDLWGNIVYPASAPNRGAFNGYVVNSFTDTCGDFNKLTSRSTNTAVDTTNPAYFAGDAGRFKRTSTATGNVVYNVTGCKRFNAAIYKYAASDLSKVKFYSSPNGTTWTLVATSYTTPVLIQSNWYSTAFTPNADLPTGTVYLKVEFSDTAYAYSPQLGQISVTLN
ncbi:MAG: right-handed parallel beta-helix repeat-containing protein [Nocardioides sp.]